MSGRAPANLRATEFGPDDRHEPARDAVDDIRTQGAAAPAGTLDALARQTLLRAAFEQAAVESAETSQPSATVVPLDKDAERKRTFVRRSLKTLVALAVLFAVGWSPTTRYFETASVEAVVNARLVTIRSPIDGELVRDSAPWDVGTTVEGGHVLLRVVNRRADRGPLTDLNRRVDLLESERDTQAVRLTHLRRFYEVLSMQSQAFQAGRVRQLEARVAEINSDIAGAASRREEAAANLTRVAALTGRGIQTPAALERATRENIVAVEAERGLRKRLTGVEVELNAARDGVFIGDSYNDQPSSSQRATETALRIGETEAELRASEARLTRLKAEQREEAARYADLAAADLVAPSPGRIWEVLTAPGEEVRRGQDLLRVLDCSAAVVSTAVSEKVFNRLQLGDTARFHLANDPESYQGKIIHLSGVAAQPENLAIQPAALAKDSYRVTVAVPNIKSGCAIGRSGRVVFATSSAPGGTAANVRSRFVGLFGLP